MWSGSGMPGNSTAFGSGKSGILSGSSSPVPGMRLAADDLDGQVAVARTVELGGDDRLELAQHDLAGRDREREPVVQQRRLQVRVGVLAVAVRVLRVVVAVVALGAHDVVQRVLDVVEQR